MIVNNTGTWSYMSIHFMKDHLLGSSPIILMGGGGQGFEKIQAPLHTKKIHYPHSTIKFYPYAYNLIFYIPKLNCFHENRLFITLLKVCQ